MMPDGLLPGVKVLDVGQGISGPCCAKILAQMGAEVIKVELPKIGDPCRRLGSMTECGDSLVWLSEARNKKSITLDLRKFGGSALTADIDVPKDGVDGTIPVTYVPARNLVFLALTTAFAESIGAGRIVIGVNALDYSGYPDCRPEFIASFAETARLGTKAGIEGGGFAIDAPLQFLGKAEIASEANRLGLDTALSWSCYDPRGDGLPCGLCDSCRLRRKGFADAGLTDGLTYPADT